eukprot:1137947-Pelagomonas_calceolata.AAC.9
MRNTTPLYAPSWPGSSYKMFGPDIERHYMRCWNAQCNSSLPGTGELRWRTPGSAFGSMQHQKHIQATTMLESKALSNQST